MYLFLVVALKKLIFWLSGTTIKEQHFWILIFFSPQNLRSFFAFLKKNLNGGVGFFLSKYNNCPFIFLYFLR